jgi:hypothetical protein
MGCHFSILCHFFGRLCSFQDLSTTVYWRFNRSWCTRSNSVSISSILLNRCVFFSEPFCLDSPPTAYKNKTKQISPSNKLVESTFVLLRDHAFVVCPFGENHLQLLFWQCTDTNGLSVP